MRMYQIFSDSACDLPEDLTKEYSIRLIPFYVSFDQETYYRENIDMSNEEFYSILASKNIFAKTSMPSVQDYINAFRPVLKEGDDIICMCLTQRFSGSYQSAVNAKHILEEQYPDSVIHIIDSIQATGGQGILLLQLACMKKAGLTIDEAVKLTNRIKSYARIMFTVDTLEYLSKGRRIGKVISLARDMLDLKPLIQLKDGELIPYSNIRGRRKSLVKVIEMVREYFIENDENPENYDFCIASAATDKDARLLMKLIEEYTGQGINNRIFQIGVTIGTYTGPGAIGVCFVKKYDRV